MAKTKTDLADTVLGLVNNARRELRATGSLSKTTIDQRDRIRLEVYYQICGHVDELLAPPTR